MDEISREENTQSRPIPRCRRETIRVAPGGASPPNPRKKNASPACHLAAVLPGVEEQEFLRCCAVLGVGPDVSPAALEKAHLQKSFALIRAGDSAGKEQLRAAYEALGAELKRREAVAATREHEGHAGTPSSGGAGIGVLPRPEVAPAVSSVRIAPAPALRPAPFDPFSFDSWLVNALALPLIAALAWLLNASPLVNLLRGFHIWMHEFGHATVAWLSGYRALPLPIGWTSVEPEKANFVYFGVLFLLGVMAVAGWRERKIWPVLIALAVVPVQFHMTWKMPEHRYEMWMAFGGIGGEFFLSAAMMALFFVHLPDKFRWGACRYVFAFLGASSFLNIWLFWRRVAQFKESIPYGTMIHGEEDGGGDMNILRDHGWREADITQAYTNLGFWCLVALAAIYVIFATRLDRLVGNFFARMWPEY